RRRAAHAAGRAAAGARHRPGPAMDPRRRGVQLMPRRLALAALACAALAASAPAAEAYPQFQLSSGSARCNLCHYAPAGGGLINGWGRTEAADTISRGGDGAFLYGAWELPDWLARGAGRRGRAGGRGTGCGAPAWL